MGAKRTLSLCRRMSALRPGMPFRGVTAVPKPVVRSALSDRADLIVARSETSRWAVFGAVKLTVDAANNIGLSGVRPFALGGMTFLLPRALQRECRQRWPHKEPSCGSRASAFSRPMARRSAAESPSCLSPSAVSPNGTYGLSLPNRI